MVDGILSYDISNECEVVQNMNLNETRGPDLDQFQPEAAGQLSYLDSFINVDILH